MTLEAELRGAEVALEAAGIRPQIGLATAAFPPEVESVLAWAVREGTTNVIQHKGAATRMAKTAGARGVANNIQVSQAARDRAAENLETGRRRAQIKRGDARTGV